MPPTPKTPPSETLEAPEPQTEVDALTLILERFDQADRRIDDLERLVRSQAQAHTDSEFVPAQYRDDEPFDPSGPPRQPRNIGRQARALCVECGATLPAHYDQCSNYKTPKAAA